MMGGSGKGARPSSFASKIISYAAIPVTLLIAAIGTMVFVFDSISLVGFLYPLLLVALGIIIFGVMSAFSRAQEKSRARSLRDAHDHGEIRRIK
jgi:hypothetical protein